MNRVLSRLRALRRRLRARPDTEHEQATLRVALVGLITFFFWGISSGSENDSILLAGLVGFFVLAIAIFLSICIWPSTNGPRRIPECLQMRAARHSPSLSQVTRVSGWSASSYSSRLATASVTAVVIYFCAR